MTQDEIIRMAREACAPNQTFNSDEEWVKRFAAIVREEYTERIAILEQDNANCRKAVSDLIDDIQKQRAAMQMALEALEESQDAFETASNGGGIDFYRFAKGLQEEITALREALAQPQISGYDREFWGDGQDHIRDVTELAQEPICKCTSCGAVYLPPAPTQCDCMPEVQEYELGSMSFAFPPPTAPNLNCKSVQKRLATSWGYVLPEQQAPVTCPDCNGSGEMETGIGMFPCDACHGSCVKYYLTVQPTAAIAALPVPEVQWRDLTAHEVTDAIREGAADGGWQGFAERIIAKFKEKQL